MWSEYIAYLIIIAAFFWAGRGIYRTLRNPGGGSSCSCCTADCKLRGLKRTAKTDRRRNCVRREENRRK